MKKTDWILPGAALFFAVLIAFVSYCDSRPTEMQTVTPERTVTEEDAGGAVVKCTITVDLNTADAEELTELPGIGPALAENIVAYREQNGPFETVEDLLLVDGIGEGTLQQLYEWTEQG